MDDVLLIRSGQNEVVAFTGIVAGEKQVLVGNDDPVRGAMSAAMRV